MGIEAGNYINDLVITNPLTTDGKNQGPNHFQLIKKVLKESLNGFTKGILLTATDTGAAAAHVLTPTTALVAYAYGQMLLYNPTHANVGATTVAVSGLAAVPIKTVLGADPSAGDIVANQPIFLFNDGTNFVIMCGSAYLSKTGNQSITGNIGMAGTLAITGSETISADLTVGGISTLSSNTSIGTLTAVELAFVHGVTSSVQAQLNSKGAISGQAWTGSHDFTGGTIAVPTQAFGNNSSSAASTSFVVSQGLSSALPGVGGQAGKSIGTDGVSPFWEFGGLTLLSVTTAANSATVDIETTFDSKFGNYLLIITGLYPVSTGSNFLCRMKIGGIYLTSASYFYHTKKLSTASAAYAATVSAGGDTSILIAESVQALVTDTAQIDMRIFNPSSGVANKHIYWEGMSSIQSSSGGHGGHNSSVTALTGLRFFASVGNIAAGTFRLYGIKNTIGT